MNASLPTITADDLKKSGWEKAIEGASRSEAHDLSFALSAAAKRMEETGEEVPARSLRFLADLCAMYFRLDEPNSPFGPVVAWSDGSHSLLPENLRDEEIAAIQGFYPFAGDPELRARLADVLWLRIRDHRAAEAAVLAYLDSARRLENPENWMDGNERIERALQLARLLNNEKLVDLVVERIEEILDKYKGEDPKFSSENLMDMLLELRRGDAEKYASFAKKAAERAEDRQDWFRAERYWTVAARWRHAVGDAEAQSEFLVQAAETFVKAADAIPSALIAAAHLERAIEAHRRLGNKARAEELHKRLLETQGQSVQEMKAVSTGIDLVEWVRKARETVGGKSLLDALLTLSMMVQTPSVKELRDEVERTAKKSPIPFIFDVTVVSEAGKKVARRPSILSNDNEEKEEAVRAEMYRRAALYHRMSAVGVVEPARDQILLEHSTRVNDFVPLLTNNPFVPPGRDRLYAMGFYHGTHGDVTAAVHILVPQLENSFRYVLRNSGAVVSRLDAKGIQDEKDMGELLEMEEFERIFGEDLTFDLRGLLISRFGTNLRNRVAHGLLESGAFQEPYCTYLWWIALHLCCIPLVSRGPPNQGKETTT